jgi:long-chain fatty acid transport protein
VGKRTIISVIATFMILGSCHLGASVFRTVELSARAATMGGAFVARTDDNSAVFYNPAGLAFSKGLKIKTNILYLSQNLSADSPWFPDQYDNTQGYIRGFHFVTFNIKNRIGLGIGAFNYNSMDTKWPASWRGRTLSVHSKLNTFYVRPVVAVKISDHLAVGAGIDFISSDITWISDTVFAFQGVNPAYFWMANSESELNGKGIGFITSILVRVNDNLQIGGRYQPKVKLDFTGSQNFIFNFSWDPAFLIDREATSNLTMPQEITLGFVYSLGKNLVFQLDFQWIGMSDMKEWEFSIDPQFYDEFEAYYGIRPYNIRLGADLNLRDVPRIMFGIEYVLENLIAIRAGYTYQKSAVANRMIHPAFPDLDTNTLSFGLGYEGPAFSIWRSGERIGGLSLDAYLQYGFSKDMKSALLTFPATYKESRWAVGVGIGFNFGSL